MENNKLSALSYSEMISIEAGGTPAYNVGYVLGVYLGAIWNGIILGK